MSKIKKYQCPSYGGDLTVDNDKQMYCCTLCGSTYLTGYYSGGSIMVGYEENSPVACVAIRKISDTTCISSMN